MAKLNLYRITQKVDPRRSLRARVGLPFGSLIILLALLLSFFVERPAQAQLERDIGNSLAALAFQVATQLDQGVRERSQDLELLATLPMMRDPALPAGSRQALLEQVRQRQEEYAWLGFVDPEGTVRASTGLLPAGLDVSERPWFLQGQHGFFIGDTQTTAAATGTPERLVTLALPVPAAAGAPAGVLVAYLNWDWAQQVGQTWLATSPAPDDVDLFILATDGALLYGSAEPDVSWATLATRIAAEPGSYGYGSEWWAGESVYLTGYARSQPGPTPALEWLVLVRQNRPTAFAPVRRLQRQILLWGTGLGLLFLALGWFLAGRIVLPLTQIATAAQRIRAGEIDATFPERSGTGEISILARSLRAMVDTLQAQKAALARNQASLEQRVRERTRTLTALYQVLEVANIAADLPAALREALAAVLAATGGEGAILHLVEGERLQLAARQGVGAEAVAAWRRETGDLPLAVLRRGETITDGEVGAAFDERFALYLGVPVVSGGAVWGILSVFGRGPDQLVEGAAALLASVADEFGIIVENARLQQRAEQLAVLEERNRLARELHDSVTQSLYSLTLFAEAGRRMLAEGDLAAATEYFGDVGETSQQALKEMRLLLHKLRPAALQQEGLVRALRQRLNAVEERSGIANELVLEGTVDLVPDVEEALYHIATEALNNALRHAQADRVRVTLRGLESEMVEMLVSDNGQGFRPAAAEQSGGMGVDNMYERARHAGGELTVESTPGQGTTVRVRLPRQINR